MSKPFCMNLWLVIPEKVRYNRKKDISKPVISGEFRCVSAEKKAGHTPGGNLWMTGFDCTKKKWGFLRMSAESKTRMTEGSISKKMILFAIPLFLGNLFQQLYNTADSLIVGNFLGSNALAAVSSSGNLIFLMVGFINGIAMGAGVVIARYYGAKNREDLQKAIHTTVAFGLAAGAALTVLGMYLAPKILVLMGTPSDVLPQSVEYFRTYFAGSLGFIMYNIFVGILQSVGDSRHPLIYLIVSSCINVALDLLFIGGLGLGVGAAALATVISCGRRKSIVFISAKSVSTAGRLARLSATVCRPVSRTRLFRSQTFSCRRTSMHSGKWRWQAAVHMQKSRVLHSFRLHALRWH